MNVTSRTESLPRRDARAIVGHVDLGAVGAWVLGFAPLTYLALKGGGYDVVVRSQVGIVVWWIVGLGALAGVVGTRRLGRPLVAAIMLLTAFSAWSLLSATWSESGERAVSEAARDITLLGCFVLAAAGVRRRQSRLLVAGVLTAIVTVAGLACLSRLDPGSLGTSQTGQFLPGAASRLSFGLNYWNALGAFAAMGIPLALAFAGTARTLPARAAANAVVPMLALALFLTLSRGAMLAGGIGLAVALALTSHRLRWLGAAALSAVGAAILINAAVQRDAVRDGLTSTLAGQQGSELIAVVLVVTAGVAFVHVGLSLARTGWSIPAVPTPSGRTKALVAGGLAVLAMVVFLAAGGPSRGADAWDRFKSPDIGVNNSTTARLGSASGNGRYQYWVSAKNALETAPVLGRGAGSFETYWARNATVSGRVRNAHSLYMETLAEVGIVGMLLLGGLILLTLGAGAARSLAGPRHARTLTAGVTAALTVFAIAAAGDWLWQVTVLPAAFLVLAPVVLRSRRGRSRSGTASSRGRRVAIGVLAAVAVIALVPSLVSTTELRKSQQAAVSGRIDAALSHAATAEDIQSYAASPPLQRALVLESRGDLAGAAAAASLAERREPRNWSAPFILARIEAERGRVKAATAAFRRAKSLNRTASFLQ